MTVNHFLDTPEALLGRSDSKNPATTCRGITNAGKPCRRALALSKADRDEEAFDGVIALLKQDAHITGAQYYCWQHKQQADAAPSPKRTETEIVKLKNRSSIDTIVQRLGIAHQDEGKVDDRSRTKRAQRAVSRSRHARKQESSNHRPGFWRSLCCMIAQDDMERIEVIRHRKRVEQGRVVANIPTPVRSTDTHGSSSQAKGRRPQQIVHSPLAMIPPDISPKIAASVLAELSKPISEHDEEGYIYIFWLTPTDRQAPGPEAATSLLSTRKRQDRRVSDVLTEFFYSGDDAATGISKTGRPDTILLKIGRANNVTRRMNEWQRQCGHRLNLVRWYPHNLPSPMPSPTKHNAAQPLYPDLSQLGKPTIDHRVSSGVTKVSNVKKVERLIHLELADQQFKQDCSACGREHREWFKIEANEAGVRRVDAVIKRWTAWSQTSSCA